MRDYVINRPDPAALEALLAREGLTPGGLILRLAWRQGLTRDEISALTWAQVDLAAGQLVLPDRTIPLDPALAAELALCRERWAGTRPYVVLTPRRRERMRPESVSRTARMALDGAGLTAVRLSDLRHDWIIRQLADMDWATVARLCGVEVTTLRSRYGAHVPEKPAPAARKPGAVDEFALWKILQAERGTPAGLALWLTWQLGLQAQEIAALTWDQIDLSQNALVLPDRTVQLTHAVRRMLEDQPRGEDPHVLLTPRSRKPMDLPRLSRLTRSALIRGGMEDVRLCDLRRDDSRGSEDARVLALVEARGNVARGDVMELLGATKTAAHDRLRRMVDQGKLVRVGGKYYLPGTVVPAEDHGEKIVDYLARAGFAYRQDIAELLRIEPKQCTLILRRMVEEGSIERKGQRYTLPK